MSLSLFLLPPPLPVSISHLSFSVLFVCLFCFLVTFASPEMGSLHTWGTLAARSFQDHTHLEHTD